MRTRAASMMLVMVLVSGMSLSVAQETIEVNFFYSPGCPHCERVSEFLDSISGEYPIQVNSINTIEDPERFLQMQQDYAVPSSEWSYVPKVFVGDYYCIGDTPCISGLEDEIESLAGGNQTVPDGGNGGELSYVQILGLAAVDAVNPCALAVLVILLTTILTRYPDMKGKALLAGLMFSASIYMCYFLMGLLIILGFKAVSGAAALSTTWLYRALGVFAIVIGAFNLKDFFRYGGGGFVMEVPMGWRPRLKRLIGSATSPAGAFVVGIAVSLFLLPCTSGPYFVAGGVLAGLSWAEALLPLLVYNLIFILPMVAITLAVYAGFAEVEHVGGWKDRNIRILHLVAGLILLGLGVVMVAGLL